MKTCIVTKDKRFIEVGSDASKNCCFWNRGAYRLHPSGIRLSYRNNRINPEAVTFFVENNPKPITAEASVNVMGILEEEFFTNTVENLTAVKGEGLGNIFWKLVNTLSNQKFVTALVVIGIAALIAYNFLTGGLTLG